LTQPDIGAITKIKFFKEVEMDGYWEAAVIAMGREDGNILVLFLNKDRPSWKLGINLLDVGKASLKHGPYCRGKISIKKISDSQKAIFCTECGLRRKFPTDVETLGSFRQFFEKESK
jgi:hypothetical protein